MGELIAEKDAGRERHWLAFNAAHDVIGCHCGFRASEPDDDGHGDSVVAHLLGVGWTEGWYVRCHTLVARNPYDGRGVDQYVGPDRSYRAPATRVTPPGVHS